MKSKLRPPTAVPKGRKKIAQRFIAGIGERHVESPAGTKEFTVSESAGENEPFCRPSGTFPSHASRPALKRWAILIRPFGTSISEFP